MSSPDHYAVLGVLPSADEVVIRAAYRALAQRYHPDKWKGDPKDATKKMAEINAAYAVLSDPKKRKSFDETRSSRSDTTQPFSDQRTGDPEPSFDPLTQDWQLAVSYYPDLEQLEAKLKYLSWRVAYAYRAELLETKRFEQRAKVAKEIEQNYFRRYFGTKPDILEFARSLIYNGYKNAALELNQAVRVFGDSIDPDLVIRKIARDHCPSDFETPEKRRKNAPQGAAEEDFFKIDVYFTFLCIIAFLVLIYLGS